MTRSSFLGKIAHMESHDISRNLYPVVCFVTGTTPNGGGIWKYVLHGSEHGLLRRNLPVMTQVLHFLDFAVSPQMLQERWRKPLREKYNGNFGLNYTESIFTDSGGFTLMFDPELDLTRYGIPKDKLAEGILRLQLDMGANFIASLDYPIPPKLAPSEAKRRMDATLKNAIRTAQILAEMDATTRPQLYVPIHGTTPEAMRAFIQKLLKRLKAEGLSDILYGLALGSMVPLRTSKRSGEILNYVEAAREEMPTTMPLHVFGITGVLTPFLLAKGATSFDTSTYIQNARVLRYLDPITRQSKHFREMKEYPCNCPICRGRDFAADLALMDGDKKGYKSEVYAALALHNLEYDFRLFHEALEAQAVGELSTFLEKIGRQFKSARPLWLAMQGEESKQAKPSINELPIRTHKPEDFDVRNKDYHPFPHKSICLILPCSQEKPYSSSQSFQFIWKKILEALGMEAIETVEVVFLSGLYGPVPIQYSEEEAVKTYDYLLHHHNQSGVQRVAQRLTDFLSTYQECFEYMVCYVTLPAYRKAVELAGRSHPVLHILPIDGRKGRTAFYRPENINQLIPALKTAVTLVTEAREIPLEMRDQSVTLSQYSVDSLQ